MKKLYTAYGIVAVLIFISGYWQFLIPLAGVVVATIIVATIVKNCSAK